MVRRAAFGVCSFLMVTVLAGCLSGAPPAVIDPPKDAPASMIQREAIQFTTTHGPITVLLYPEAAPRTVDLMKAYVRENYYLGREFGRAVPGHVIQVTDRFYTGATDDLRRVPLEPHPDYHFSAGAVGIARSEDPDSGGPEFFIMDFATSHLDGNYTVWGQVVDGLHVVHRLARVDGIMPPASIPLLRPREVIAYEPGKITGASLLQLPLPASEADPYPYAVAQNARAGEYRHSLDWPRTLAAGVPTTFTWYVFPYNSTAPPWHGEVTIHVANETIPVAGESTAEGVYYWAWTPPAAGTYYARLLHRGDALATLEIPVPEPMRRAA